MIKMTILNLPFWNDTQKKLYETYMINHDFIGIDGLYKQMISKIFEVFIDTINELIGFLDISRHPFKNRIINLRDKYQEFYDMI